MKSQRGVTLTSLIVYVISMVIIISVMAVITTNFYRNINNTNNTVEPYTEYVKFNSYFSNEVNESNIKVLECKENYIVFDNGIQYTFIAENKSIYQNKVKICKNVTSCTFSTEIKNGNNVVNVQFTIGDKTYSNTYTLKK